MYIQMEKEPRFAVAVETPEDVEGSAEVFYRTWLATYPNEEFGITRDDIEDRFKSWNSEQALTSRRVRAAHPLEGETSLVAKDGERVVGVCRVRKHAEHNQLHAIYVLPEYQGKGLGGLLWENAQPFLDPKKDTIVQAAVYNANAIDFYKRLGFEDTGKRWSNEQFKMKSGAVIPELELRLKVAA